MLNVEFKSIFVCMSLVGLFSQFNNLEAMNMSAEDKAARFAAGELIRTERAAKKSQGGYSDAVYNTGFSVLPEKAIKTTGKFKAFGLAAVLYEEKSIIKRVGAMDVEFYPGLDIFGNVIDPVQWSCSTPQCGDVKCAPSFISSVRLNKMMQSKK